MNDEALEERATGGILLATDGSEHAAAALAVGLRLVDPGLDRLLVTVVPAVDPMMMVGGGHSGAVMTPFEGESLIEEREAGAQVVLDGTLAALAESGTSVDSIDTMILWGDPGSEICRHAAEQAVEAIVLGTSGRGGLKRAFLGSVSDHVVRHAHCPVVTVNED